MKHTISLLALIGLAHGHGFVTSPKPRMPGSAMEAACGQQVVTNQQSDNYGNVQGELQVTSGQDDFSAEKCNIFLCKGYKFEDNKDNVYSYSAGQKIDFKVDVRAPHTGVANVSVVDTASNSVIGEPLKSWEKYASTETGVADSDKEFSVTLPDNLSQCSEAGACVLQWYWFAESIDQTYESCVDFTVDGSGAGTGPSDPSPTTSSVPTTTAAPTQSAPAPPAIPTTLSTIGKPAPTGLPQINPGMPTDATAEEKLEWVGGVLKSLLGYFR